MRTQLDAADIARYREDGYLLVEPFLSPSELEALAQALEVTLARMGRARVAGNPELDEPEGPSQTVQAAHRVALQRLNLWKLDPVVRRYLLAPELGRMLCELEGTDGLRVFHDQVFYKPPFGAPTAYHLDMPNWSFRSPHGVQIWIAIDAATHDNGCMRYFPGSHRYTSPDRTASIFDAMDATLKLYPELAGCTPVEVEVPAGAAIVHNGLTVHGTFANGTDRVRRAMSCQYMPDGSRFNGRRSILSSEQLAALKVGDLLDDERHHPLVYRRPGS